MTKSVKMRNRKWIIPAAHLLGWVLFFSIPFFSHSNQGNDFMHLPGQPAFNQVPGNYPAPMPDSSTGSALFAPHPQMSHPMPGWDTFFYFELIVDGLLVVIFYLNILKIAPFFVTKKFYARYAGIQFFIGVAFYSLVRLVAVIVLPFGNKLPVGMHVFNYSIIVLVSLCYSLVSENMRVERMQKDKENQTLRTELSFLRWQISPHFLFNVLNNMVSLARIKSEKLEGMLLNLSSLMRYMLYESESDHKVSIEIETEYLQSYISLQNLRFGNDVLVTSNIADAENAGRQYVIEPMLLIPFIENAFKHGIGSIENPVIDIRLHFDNSMLIMTVSNKYKEVPNEEKDATSGIGLTNVRKRLNLLYPGKHSLSISRNNGWYSSTVKIDLS